MLAAECTTPWRTTPGTVTPTGPSAVREPGEQLDEHAAPRRPGWRAAGWRRGRARRRSRRRRGRPGAALMPLPPKSTPQGRESGVPAVGFVGIRPSHRVPAAEASVPACGLSGAGQVRRVAAPRAVYKFAPLVNRFTNPSVLVNLRVAPAPTPAGRRTDVSRPAPRSIANSTVPAGSTAAVEGPEALPLADRAGGAVAGLHRLRHVAR